MRRLTLLLPVVLLAGLLSPTAAVGAELPPWEVTLDLTFPSTANAQFSNTYDACRSGCSRMHQATDVMAAKHTPLFAVTEGTVCRIDEGEEDSYGRHLTVCGDDGNRYRYLHMNNDTPGTDDGQAGLEHVYAPGIVRGVRVARGQLLGWMGDSGNAESTPPHLHFDIFVPGVENPWGEERINPYRSLKAAYDRGDFSDGTAMPSEARHRIGGSTRIETAIMLSRRAFESADHVVLASASTPQDAIVAGPLAAALEGPVLITTDPVPANVLSEIDRLGATQITIIGSTPADVGRLQRLVGSDAVRRIDGGNPVATSVLVAEELFALLGADGESVTELTARELTQDELLVPTLQITDQRDRGDQRALDGAVVPSTLDEFYVELAGAGVRIDKVDFFLDDDYVRTERYEPYDLGGTGRRDRPGGIRTDWLSEGAHTVVAYVHHAGGVTEVAATFTVVEGGANGRRALIALGMHPDASKAWPDALMGSWYGSVRDMPVLLTTPTSLPRRAADLVATLESAIVVGGPGVIPAEQFEAIDGLVAGTVRRMSGPDRYATAAALADDLVSRRLADATTLFVATGERWPDAVAAGPAVARLGSTLMLVDGSRGSSDAAREFVRQQSSAASGVVALGGTGALAEDVLRLVAWWAV